MLTIVVVMKKLAGSFYRRLPLSALLLLLSPVLHAQSVGVDTSAGQAIYERDCASCHDRPEETKAPALSSLQQMGVRAISYALTHGKMKVNAAMLTPADIDAVVGFLAASTEIDNAWVDALRCDAPRDGVDSSAPALIAGFGFDLHNQRQLSAEVSGLHKEDLGRLELKWALAFPQTGNMRAQPAVLGNTLFLSIADSGQLYALDVREGEPPCVQWVYDHGLPLRTAIGLGEVEGRSVLVFGDGAAHIQMLDAEKGFLLWRSSVRVTSVSNATGMPVLYQDRVYVPVSSGELNMGAAPEYECCTSHGAVVALSAKNGDTEWIYRTMEAATPRGVSRVGTQQWGPSGAPIWTTPAIDEERGVLYVGTGQNTSEPATDTSDAILAIDLDDGSLRWQFQATANDIFLTGCMFEPEGPNCPPAYSVNADWDFGASVILTQTSDKRDIILAGQKSGTLWALDPDNEGALLWSTEVGPGCPAGGIHWGMAVVDNRVFAAINQVGIVGEPEDEEPGLHALSIDTGERLWSFINAPDCSAERQQRLPACANNYGLSAATLVVDGAVVQGGNDGYVRIFDVTDGSLLFKADTTLPVPTINGVEGRGGSIDNASIVAAHGLLLVQSGYGLLGAPGNLLLAYGVRD